MKRTFTGITLLIIILLTAGCIGRARVGETQTDTRTIELGDAETARVDIKMGVGEVKIDSGADALLEAEFTYNVEAWEPEVDYRISGREGRLSVQQPENEGLRGIPDDDDVRYEWDLRLNPDVPMNLDVTLGVGESDLDLQGLNLTNLDVKVGVGETTIDLSGDWEDDFDVHIQGGVGKTTVILPRDVGVRAETQTGIGSIDAHGLIRDGNTYTNEAYEGADVIVDIRIQGGVGEIELELGE